MRSMMTVMPWTSTSGLKKLASARACSRPSLMPRRSTTATMRRRPRAGNCLDVKTSAKASRSSSDGYLADGTNCLRSASSAQCSDHASWQRRPESARTCAGEGATVERTTFLPPTAKRRLSVMAATAGSTEARLAKGSPMPIKTTFVAGGRPRWAARRRPWTTWATSSSGWRLRIMPMDAVRQKRQPWAQPTCELMQMVVELSLRPTRRCRRSAMASTCGMSTDSTECPSCKRNRNFAVPRPSPSPSFTAVSRSP
mmetsp:Transcript_110364/g.330046  ORF Transcript_110364/g.330046 Transcript_110364/m.330046 type:complete len:255 (-) Transcript_110364:331-1095(-)